MRTVSRWTTRLRLAKAPLIAAVGTGRAFALAPPGLAQPPPEGVTWRPLTGSPIIRRTWAVYLASSRRRDLAALVAALDLTLR